MANREDVEVLVKSRRRVADHGEVFTPKWLVNDMLALVRQETERIDSRFLEPACGSGNFLVPVLERKLSAVQKRHGRSTFEKRHYALFALMCVYGIELLEDNVAECRQSLRATFEGFLGVGVGDVWSVAAKAVLNSNIVLGDALTMAAPDGAPLSFPEWGYLGRGKFQRRDFRFDSLAQRASAVESAFKPFKEHDIFTPIHSYPPMNVQAIAA